MENVTKIDLEKLASCITDLETLNKEWMNKTYSRDAVGDNAGYTVIQMELLSATYVKMQASFVNLMDKTITYMTNRKTAFESQDNTATDVIETKEPFVKPGTTGNKNSGAIGNTPLIK